jgi:hypothetical protein
MGYVRFANWLGTVIYEAIARGKLREQQRRGQLINLITNIWNSTLDGGMTIEERCGFPSERMIEFFSSELRKRGETWTFPE